MHPLESFLKALQIVLLLTLKYELENQGSMEAKVAQLRLMMHVKMRVRLEAHMPGRIESSVFI